MMSCDSLLKISKMSNGIIIAKKLKVSFTRAIQFKEIRDRILRETCYKFEGYIFFLPAIKDSHTFQTLYDLAIEFCHNKFDSFAVTSFLFPCRWP